MCIGMKEGGWRYLVVPIDSTCVCVKIYVLDIYMVCVCVCVCMWMNWWGELFISNVGVTICD